MPPELDARAAFCLGTAQARMFQINGAVLNVEAKLPSRSSSISER
jgi:hypothetical protein